MVFVATWHSGVWAFGDWLAEPMLRWPLSLAYLTAVVPTLIFGLHRYWLVWLWLRHRGGARLAASPPPAITATSEPQLPSVTVQIPIFNEAAVAARVIDAVCQMQYPRERLQIQVLDDSTDATLDITLRRVAHWRDAGVNIDHRHRTDRVGFKAGALAEGLPHATGDFVALFDTDFVPPPDFLLRVMGGFADPRVGMVQTRWGHMNAADSLLTRAQSVLLDGQFLIEHISRSRSGRWFNFNGTAGVWRKQALLDAGGWTPDTLTEDLDISYRAQLAGWRFVYMPNVVCPAELPPTVSGFRSQQHRWAKGMIQTSLKLLPRLWRSAAPWPVRLEAVLHMTAPISFLTTTLTVLLLYPAMHVNLQPVAGGVATAMFGLALLSAGTFSAAIFYVLAQRLQGRGWGESLAFVPILMAVGVGVSLSNAVGVAEALVGRRSPFVRTPKFGGGHTKRQDNADQPTASRRPATRSRRQGARWPSPAPMAWLELAMGLYMLECCRQAWLAGPAAWQALPFLTIFAAGYFYMAVSDTMRRPPGAAT